MPKIQATVNNNITIQTNETDEIKIAKLQSALDDARASANGFESSLTAANAQLDAMRERLEDVKRGNGMAFLEEQLDRFKETAETAAGEFENFLRTVNLVDDYGRGSDRFSEMFDQIREGSITTSQAIAKVKREYDYLLLENSRDGDGLFDAQTVQQFSSALENLGSTLDVVLQKLQSIETDGVKTFNNGTTSASQGGVATSIEQIAAALSSLPADTQQAYESITNLLSAISHITEIDQNVLYGVAQTFRSISDVGSSGFSGEKVNNIIRLVTQLQTLSGSGAGRISFNTDGLTKLSVTKTTVENLRSFTEIINSLDVTKLQQFVNLNWSNLTGPNGLGGLKVNKGALTELTTLADSLRMIQNVKNLDNVAGQMNPEYNAAKNLLSRSKTALMNMKSQYAEGSFVYPTAWNDLEAHIKVVQGAKFDVTAQQTQRLASALTAATHASKALDAEFKALGKQQAILTRLRDALGLGANDPITSGPAVVTKFANALSGYKLGSGGMADIEKQGREVQAWLKQVDGYEKQIGKLEDQWAGAAEPSENMFNMLATLRSVFDEVKTGSKTFSDLEANIRAVEQAFKDEATAARQSVRSADQIEKQRQSLSATLTGSWFDKEFARLDSGLQNVSPEKVESARALLQEIQQFGDVSKLSAEQVQELANKLAAYKKEAANLGGVETGTKKQQDLATAMSNLQNQYQDYMTKYGENLRKNAPLMEKFTQYYADIQRGNLSQNEGTKQWAELRAQAKAAGVEVQTVSQRLKNLFGQHFNTALIMAALNGLRLALRQLWQDIRDVNDALVQTQVVTGLTGAALENYTDRAYAAAARSRDTVVNILESATAFGRLGYDSDLSVQLAELTSMYSKLGDTDVSSATDAITAMMKAFRLEDASEIEAALDKLIYVGNNFPISAAGLGEGLNNAASALASAGNSLEETLSLLMAANATVQNPAKASTAMRTITARIRNTTAELDELGESLDEEYDTVAKYRAQLKGLSGVDILQADGKTFRSTYDILQDLSKAWQGLTDAQRAAITTMVAGTRNTDIFASLMQNFPEAEAAMAGMDDSVGLMDEKFTAVADSISGAISELSNAWSKFSTNLANSKDIVNAIKMLTELVGALDKIRGFVGTGGLVGALSLIPTMANSMKSLNFSELRGFASMLSGGIGDTTKWQTVIDAMKTMNPMQRQVIMNFAELGTVSEDAFRSEAKAQGVTLGLSGAMGTLSASLKNAKFNIENFIASGNLYIILIQAIIIAISAAVQNYQQEQEEIKRTRTAMRDEANDSIKAVGKTIDSFKERSAAVDDYRERLLSIASARETANGDTETLIQADKDLRSVQVDIIKTFGAESGAISGVVNDLREYANALDDIAARSRWNTLNDSANAAGTAAALQMFGVDRSGQRVDPQEQIFDFSGLAYTYTTRKLYGDSDYAGMTTRLERSVQDYIRDILGPLADELDVANIIAAGTEYIEDEFGTTVKQTGVIKQINFGNKTIAEIISTLERQFALLEDVDKEAADVVSGMLKQIKAQTGYDEAFAVYQEYMRGLMQFGNVDTDLQGIYANILQQQAAFDKAVTEGNKGAAITAAQTVMDLIAEATVYARDNGFEWAMEFFSGMKSAFDASATPALYGLDVPPTTTMQYASATRNAGSGVDTSAAFTSNSVREQGQAIESLKTFGNDVINAKEALANIRSTFEAGGEIAEDELENITKVTGKFFDEIDEDVLKRIEDTLTQAEQEYDTSVESTFNDAIKWLESNADEISSVLGKDFNIFDYFNSETGTWDISGILAALETGGAQISAMAGAVGAQNGLAYVNAAIENGQATLTSSISTDENGLATLTTQFVGGTGTGAPTPKKSGGGGGGGKSSQLSKAYQSDIDALDEIIDLWKKLLNYYDEGSDQWIKRQTDIIDKYKAGVEIAQTEYNRLIAKGLKQTDDDVKTLVDKILDYQDAIFQESENLWEAVRQNQIDAIQHTLDQNDAATQLEETHHELVLAIRDERRELEDELKAARNAYSEVMTPQELDALFSPDDFAELMGKLADIEGDAMSMYRDYRSQIAAVSEDETYLIEHITDEFERQYELKMKEYEVAKQELAVARAQRELDNVREERNTAMLINGSWQWVADPAALLEAENKLADAQQELADAQDEYDFQTLVKRMEAQSSELQKQIDALEALRFSMDELANQIHLFSDKVYKDLLTYLSATAQASFSKFDGSTAVPQFHTGGVVGKGGLAQLHDDEIIFNSADAAKLWRLVHNSPGVQVDTGAVLKGIAKLAVGKPAQATGSQAGSVSNVVQIGDLVIEGEKARQFIEVLRDVVAPYQPNNN